LPPNIPDDIKPTKAVEVTTRPLDKARDANTTTNQVNLYLYHTLPSAAWRNTDLPLQAKSGDIALPPLALNLHYLITAYAENNEEQIAQLLLGRAMHALHDNALLMPKDISDAFAASDLQDQVERVRITAQPLSLEEMSKLWMTFQTQYRISAAYEVAVVLIESTRPKRSPLPVREPRIYVSSFRRPVIDEVSPQIVLSGGKLTIKGQNLKGDLVKLRFGPTLADPDPSTVSDQQLEVAVPAALRAGVNTVQVVYELQLGTPPAPHPGAGFESNVAAFMLAPRITTASPISVAAGATLTLAVTPPVHREQRVAALLVGDETVIPPRAITLPAIPRPVIEPSVPVASLDFSVPADLQPGVFLLRVQVDGAESKLVTDTDPASPTFNQYIRPKVTIT
jgi:hypothetical protein